MRAVTRRGRQVSSTRKSPMSAAQVLAAYQEGQRDFVNLPADGIKLTGVNLEGATFAGASLRGADFTGSHLTHVQFKVADARDAIFRNADINATDLICANFDGADFTHADLTGAALNRANFANASLSHAMLGNARLTETIMTNTTFDGAHLSSTNLSDTDVSSLCDAKRLQHGGPSNIDARTVIKSYQHPRMMEFMIECGVPPIFADYMIECAASIEKSLLRSLMQSTFISYGGPDVSFARKLYEALKARGVTTFFFPETATVGERIDNEVFSQLQEHDRIILVCSRASLDRPGVINEIQETFDREARDGGATYLLPITLDDYVFTDWKLKQPVLAERIGRRVVGDFRKAKYSQYEFEKSLNRLIDALRRRRP
jgi:uncharacterized protein YjbI with pentapeptide repeats